MNTSPPYCAYARINEVLSGDNALKRRLSSTTVAVFRQNRTHADFPLEVAYVTEHLFRAGHNLYTLTKLDILRHAMSLLVSNPPSPEAMLASVKTTPPPTAMKSKPTPPPIRLRAIANAPLTPISVEINERVKALRSTIADLQKELDDSLRAQAALNCVPKQRQKIERQKPARQSVDDFEKFVLEMLSAKGEMRLNDVIKANPNPLTKAPTWTRLKKMAAKNLLVFEGGKISPQNQPSS